MAEPKDPKSPLSPDGEQRQREAQERAREEQAVRDREAAKTPGRRQDVAAPNPQSSRPRADARHPEIAGSYDPDDLDVGRAGHIDERTGYRVATERQVNEAWEDLPKTEPGSHKATDRGYATVPGKDGNAGILVEVGEYVPAGVVISDVWMKSTAESKPTPESEKGEDPGRTLPTRPAPRSQSEAMISGHPLPHPPKMPGMPQFTKAQLQDMTKPELEGAAQERGIENISDLSRNELIDALRGV